MDDAVSLQNNLDTLQQWEKDWLMSFNPDTCEVIRITNKKRIIELCTLMEEEEELGHFVPSKMCVEYHIYVFIGMEKKRN